MKESSKLHEVKRLSETTITKLKLLEDYKFRVEFDVEDMLAS